MVSKSKVVCKTQYSFPSERRYYEKGKLYEYFSYNKNGEKYFMVKTNEREYPFNEKYFDIYFIKLELYRDININNVLLDV